MTGRRSHGRLSALNGVVHQGRPWPETFAVLAGGMTTVAPRAVAVS